MERSVRWIEGAGEAIPAAGMRLGRVGFVHEDVYEISYTIMQLAVRMNNCRSDDKYTERAAVASIC